MKRKKIMKYFTMNELTNSQTAKQRGIDNTPPKEVVLNLVKLVDNVLDPLRERYGKPIRVTSGYRSEELNISLKGAKTSHHLKGQAADITVGTKVGNRLLYELIRDNFKYTQLINEHDFSWVHVSYDENDLRMQQLKI